MRLFFCELKKTQKNIEFIFYMLEKLKHMDMISWKLKNLKKHKFSFFGNLNKFKEDFLACKLKKLKKHGFIFLQATKTQKR